MYFEGLLPVGSVIKLKESKKRIMIIGVCQKIAGDEPGNDHVYDYVGCPFPEGYLGATANLLFDGSQIETLYAIGYQDAEQLNFKQKADAVIAEVRKAEKNKADK